tara:strand:+ start:585 stop:1751 length:1167 start_codon:yes stop_codon:yes gene_type:complete
MKLLGLDYLNISKHFNDEEILLQNTLRKFVNKEVMPTIEEDFINSKFDLNLPRKLGNIGLLGITIPKKYNGADMNSIAYGLACQELERGDSGIRSFASVQNSLVMYPIYKYGTESQKIKWLKLLSKGKLVGAFGLTESDYGSNPAGMLTNAKKIEKGYILNGSKMWITNGNIADICIVWAKLNGDIHGFIVEKDMEGFSAPEIKNKWSLRTSATSELIFDNVFIPEENLLPKVKGLKGPLSCLTQARYGIGWGAIGASMALYEASIKYAKERKQFNAPIASFQLIQEKLTWMLSEITKAQLLALEVGRNKDSKSLRHQQVSLLKRNNVWMARKCAKLAREIHGANGISSEYPIMRHLMNIESVYTYEGTHEMHTLIIGHDITDIPSYS